MEKSEFLKIYKRNYTHTNISTCVRQLDELLGGLQKGKLTSILGFTGCFKTTWALNIAYAGQLEGLNTLYLSLEVTKFDVLSNLLSRHSNQPKFEHQIPHMDLKQRKLSLEKEKYLEDIIWPDYDTLRGKIYIVDETDIGAYTEDALEEAFTKVNNQAIEETGHGIDICVVDHINLLKFGNSNLGVTDSVNKYTTFFRRQAFNWCKTGESVAMILVAQASRRGGEYARKYNGSYLLGHFAEGNELERASSVVLTTYSDDGLKILYQAKVGLIKNRDGSPLEFAFETPIEPEYYTFGNTLVNAEIENDWHMYTYDDIMGIDI